MSERRPPALSLVEGQGNGTAASGRSSRRRYTKRQRVTAVIAAEMTSISAAARALGTNESTVRYWMDDPAFATYREKTRDELGPEGIALAHNVLGEIRRRLPEFEPRDLSTLYGILIDKAQLVSGHATSRTETRDITDTMTPEAVDALADEIDAWLLARKS